MIHKRRLTWYTKRFILLVSFTVSRKASNMFTLTEEGRKAIFEALEKAPRAETASDRYYRLFPAIEHQILRSCLRAAFPELWQKLDSLVVDCAMALCYQYQLSFRVSGAKALPKTYADSLSQLGSSVAWTNTPVRNRMIAYLQTFYPMPVNELLEIMGSKWSLKRRSESS